jgi:hypothetical protein
MKLQSLRSYPTPTPVDNSTPAEKNNVLKSNQRNSFAYSPEQLLRITSRSPEWTKISNHEKDKLGLTFEDDGEFW